MRTYKVTKGHIITNQGLQYDVNETMTVPEPLQKQMISCISFHVQGVVIYGQIISSHLCILKRNLFTPWLNTFKPQ